MNKTRKAIVSVAGTVAVLVTVGFGATGCSLSKYTEPFKDAPRSDTVNNDPADLIEMPDGFNNLATKCDHGNRIYVTYHGDAAYGSLAVVPDAKDC